MVASDVGKVGVAISSIDDMEELFGGIPLDRVSTSMTINATGPSPLLSTSRWRRSRAFPADKLSGTTQNDILKE